MTLEMAAISSEILQTFRVDWNQRIYENEEIYYRTRDYHDSLVYNWEKGHRKMWRNCQKLIILPNMYVMLADFIFPQSGRKEVKEK
jgi:hypothetical protein